MSIGRNEPCPCGSGRKYKHCCLAKTVAEHATEPVAMAAQRKAYEWLEARFGRHMREDIVDDYLEIVFEEIVADDDDDIGGDEDEPREEDDALLSRFLRRLSENEFYIFTTGLNDWALHEARYQRHGRCARGIEWVLQAGDLHLSKPQRSFLEATLPSRLGVYEVIGVERDRGLSLRDVLDPDSSLLFVHEIAATHGLETGDVIGARMIVHDDRLELGGALYPLSPIGVLELLADLHEHPVPPETRNADEETDTAENPDSNDTLATRIRDNWLLDRVRPPFLRALPISRGTVVRDTYDVLDNAALNKALNGCAGITPIGENRMWMHATGGDRIPQLILHPFEGSFEECDRSTIVTSSADAEAADAERAWFESTVGASVRHREREREHVDVPDNDAFNVPLPTDAPDDTLAPEERTETARLQYERNYSDWCDAPLDILDARAPRALLADAAGAFRVRLLLRVYDDTETAIARHEERPPVSFDFLRERLGLSPAG